MTVRSWITLLQERFLVFLPLIYLGYALPIVTAFALISPPFQAPDEFCHFFRVVQISEGHLFATRSPDPAAPLNNTSGGSISSNAIWLAMDPTFQSLPFHSETTFDSARAGHAHLFDKPWGDKVEFVSFPNTATYPFTCYLPAAAGLAIGRWTDLSILESYFLARLFNAFASVIFSALAIHLVSRGKLIMACILSLPMTLFLFSSLSQDAMLISYIALTVAFLNRYLDTPSAQRTLGGLGAVFFFFTLSIIGRPPHLPFLLMGILFVSWGARSVKAVIAMTGFTLAAIVAYLFSIKPLGYFVIPGVNPETQKAFIFHHPIEMLSLTFKTILDYSSNYFHNFIGTLGWLDYGLPEPFYPLVGCALVVALLSDFKFKDQGLPAWSRFAAVAFPVMVIMLIFVALFIFDNSANVHIDGVQGRYFIPVALMFTLVMGNRDMGFNGDFRFQFARLLAGVISLAIIIVTGFAACLACLCRYYY